jgi:hypothetical protein
MKAKLGPDHPHTLASMRNLAISYAALGRHADALKLREETLALYKAKLGPDHPDTLMSMNNLAVSYTALGRHADALKLHEETLALMKAKLGPEHPSTLISMENLATSYLLFLRLADAQKLLMMLHLRHFVKTKDPAGCRQTAEMWEKLNRTDADSLYEAACMRAVTAAVLTGAKQADAEAEKAMVWLKQAVAAGYKDAAHMEKDKDLDAVRNREDFKKLLAELAAGSAKQK